MRYDQIRPAVRTAAAAVLAAWLHSVPGIAAELPEPQGAFGRNLQPIAARPMAPEIAFKDESGQDRGFVELRGRVVIAIFWATWCPICAVEMPKLDRLQAEIGEQRLLVVALSQDKGGVDVVRPYYQARGIRHLGVFVDPESIMASIMGIRGVPTVFVIDPQGRMVGVVEGMADWNSPQAIAYLRGVLEADDVIAGDVPAR